MTCKYFYCTSLISISVVEGNAAYDSRNDCNAIIVTSRNTLLAGCNNTIIPEGVTSIGDYAFCGCAGQTSITIPEGVSSIGKSAFSGCTGLNSITIPESVTSIGNYAFEYCTGEVTINCDITSEAALARSHFTSVKMNGETLGYNAFKNVNTIQMVEFGENVQNIKDGAFSGCASLASVRIRSRLKSIGSQAFSGTNLSIIVCESDKPSTNVAGNAFDSNVYDRAFLYVPVGYEDEYMFAPVWCLFSKIRTRDFGTKDCLLTIKGIGGSVTLTCRTKNSYTLQISTDTGWKISNAMFNGADVTDQAIRGTYTTPSLTGDSELSIVFEQGGSAVKDVETGGQLRVRASGSMLYIDNEGNAVMAGIYTTDGKQVKNVEAVNGTTSVSLQTGNIYLIKIGERTFKVAM